VGAFLKVYSFYLPKEELKPEPATPRKSVNLQPTVSGLLTPKKPRSVTFPEAPLISSITSSTRLRAMIGNAPKDSSRELYPPRQSWDASRTDPKDILNKPESSEEIVSTIQKPRGSLTPPSNSSDLGERTPKENEGPPRLPPRSYKRPSTVPTKSKEEAKKYHFDTKLKPEAVPTWDGNENTLTRWMEKVRQLAIISPDIYKELGMIVPRRLTHSAETWYYSIAA